ncbi:MAG: triple tyrosine motif-containing protein, partial [Flavisolibacter sp.]
KYWISCDSGLVQFDPVTRHMNYRGHNIDNDPVIKTFEKQRRSNGISTDAKGNVFFTFWPPGVGQPTIFRYNRALGKAESFSHFDQLGYHEIYGYLLQRNGRLWIYGMPFFAEWTDEKKLNLIPNEYRNEQSLRFDDAYSAFEDKENNIWIATDNGVYLFNPDAQIFNTYTLARSDGKPPVEAPVQAVEEMPDGRIFIGCWGRAGLYCYDKKFHPIALPSVIGGQAENMTLWDMTLNSKSGDLWITLQGGGIAVYSPKKNSFIKLYPEIFKGSTVRQVDEDTSGNLWFGTHSGRIIRWDYLKSGNDPSKGYEFVCETGMVQKLHFDYRGYMYVGTMGRGLLKINSRTKITEKIFTATGKERERLYTNSVSDMTYYNDTTLLIASKCLNIMNTKTGKVTFFNTSNGLPTNTTESVEMDRKGIVWIGMTNGICRVNLVKRLATYYDRRDGIAYDKFNIAGVQELSDGRVVFYTDHNFLVFDPENFGQQNNPPKPFITSFEVGGVALSIDSIHEQNRAILKYNNTSIAINFSALSYLQQRKSQYYYMLEGLDHDWIRTDHPNEVLYNFLQPGDYTFMVKTENADGISNPEIAMLRITVRAPFWKTWWFFSLVALMIIAFLYLLDRERMNKMRSLQQVRRQIRLNLRNEVSNTLNNINVLSEIAKMKADRNVEQSKEFIDQISDKSRYMMEALDDTLWSIDPSNDSMRKTLLRLKELTEGLRSSSNIDIDLIVDNRVKNLELDMKLRHELFFFYKEAMNFIVQNIACNQVFVNFNKMRSKLLVEILCECDHHPEKYKSRFSDAVSKRIAEMPATMEVMADNRSFAVVLNVEIR